MTPKELNRIFSKGECLSLDIMRLYNDGKLNKKSMHEVEKHLLECALCSGAVDGLNSKRIDEVNKLSTHIQRRLAVYINTPPRIPFFRRFGLMIISVFILLCIGGSWLYYSKYYTKNYPKISSNTNSKNQKQVQVFDDKAENSITLPVENQTENSTIAPEPNKNASTEKKPGNNSVILQNLPAETEGQPNTLTVKQETPSTTTVVSNDNDGPNTRNAVSNQPVRVKYVTIYPPVTHNDKQSRHDAKDGQLGRSSNSGASFELEEMPFFPGGTEAMRNYIINNFKPTAVDRSKLTRFATGVMFVVNSKTGAITYSEISFEISPEIDKELLRVINAMPKWSPGKKRGEVDVMIGVTFE